MEALTALCEGAGTWFEQDSGWCILGTHHLFTKAPWCTSSQGQGLVLGELQCVEGWERPSYARMDSSTQGPEMFQAQAVAKTWGSGACCWLLVKDGGQVQEWRQLQQREPCVQRARWQKVWNVPTRGRAGGWGMISWSWAVGRDGLLKACLPYKGDLYGQRSPWRILKQKKDMISSHWSLRVQKRGERSAWRPSGYGGAASGQE